MARFKKIMIYNAIPSEKDDLNSKIQWFALSLGFFSERDKDRTLFRIFLELFRNSKQHIAVSSEELSLKLKISRGTVVHHLHKLQDAGLVDSESNRYFLVSSSLHELVEYVKNNINRTIKDIDKIAKEIDDEIDKFFSSNKRI